MAGELHLLLALSWLLGRQLCKKKTKESPLFKELKKEKKLCKRPLKSAIEGPKMPLIWTFVLTGYVGVAYYMMATFLPNILISKRGFDVNKIMFITVVASSLYAFVSPIFGWLSDLYGRKPVLYIPITLIAVLSYPMFMLFNSAALSGVLLALSVFALLISAMTAAFQVAVTELFPTEHRYSGMSVAYNTGNAIFAGTTPMICIWLVSSFSSAYAPCFYLIIASVITLMLIYKMPETSCSNEFESA